MERRQPRDHMSEAAVASAPRRIWLVGGWVGCKEWDGIVCEWGALVCGGGERSHTHTHTERIHSSIEPPTHTHTHRIAHQNTTTEAPPPHTHDTHGTYTLLQTDLRRQQDLLAALALLPLLLQLLQRCFYPPRHTHTPNQKRRNENQRIKNKIKCMCAP
jgi:hypothetical protein